MLKALVVVALALSGCTVSKKVLLRTSAQPVDSTVAHPKAGAKKRVMVLSNRIKREGAHDEAIIWLQRELMARGIELISSGVTGRVIDGASPSRIETASQLPDLERALVMAKRSGAEALLNVSEIGWTTARRDLCITGVDPLEAVPVKINDACPVSRGWIPSEVFVFSAQMIDPETGLVTHSFNVSQFDIGAIDKVFLVCTKEVVNEMYSCPAPGFDAKRTARNQVLEIVANRLAGPPELVETQ